MNERRKLAEAKYFYSRMVEEQSNRDNFSHNLSAFLSSARSVLQYAFSELELKENKEGKKWYDSCVSASPILRFFKDKRDINIHTEPVSPVKNTHLTLKDTLGISDWVLVIHRDKNGNIIQQHSNEFHSKSESTKGQVTRQVEYKFSDWKGDESVLALCQKYLQELERFIENGVSEGFITG
jgi:hypothetical protein